MRFESFYEMLEHYARLQPDKPALKSRDGVLSYAALLSAVKLREAELRASKKTCLALIADGSTACVIEILAANTAGMQIVMLDPSLDDDLLLSLLPYADADAVFADEELKELLSPSLTGGVSDGHDRLLFFTSGTTDRSKAVVLTGKSLCASARNGSAMLPLSASDTLLCILPLSHVFGFVCGLLWGLSCGACVALGNGPRGVFTDFSVFHPTAVSLVPALLAALLKMNTANEELRTVLIGAGDCPKEWIREAAARGLNMSFGYGLTETSSGVAISTEGDPFALSVCPDDRITIAADQEILIEAPTCIMQGYYKDPTATKAVLKDGVLHTGDLGYLDESGKLHITGRKKEMLVLSDGTKIFLPEYEGALKEVLKDADLAVDLSAGRPVLLIFTEDTKAGLLQKLRPVMEKLPRGQQLTDVLIMNEPLPRTATGKIKRWELRQKAGLQ